MEDVDVTGDDIGIISKAGRLSLNMSAVLELAYEKKSAPVDILWRPHQRL